MFSDIFKQLIHNKRITAYQLARETGLSDSLISNWKSGRQLPKYDSLNLLADYFEVTGDYLLGRTDIPNVYLQQINNKGVNVSFTPLEKTIILPFYRTPSSAGSGSMLFDEMPVEYMNVPKTLETADADFMIEVRGDSMVPKYNDGDVVLVKHSESIYENEIGIFILNGESFVKKMGKGCLISLNPAYIPIELREFDSVSCAGKVIGTIELN